MGYFVEVEKADGGVLYTFNGKEFEDKWDAEERAEFLWNLHAHTGDYAAFRVIGTDGETYSELEC
jgi:hypothetical protein